MFCQARGKALPTLWHDFANVVAKLCQHRGTSTNKPAVETMQLHG